MSLVLPIRKSRYGLISYRVAIMCVAALSFLLARNAPPSFPHTSISLTISSHADHDPKPCFDHDDSQWALPPSAALGAPPPVMSAHLTPTVEPFVEIVTDGLHYNRPPPIS